VGLVFVASAILKYISIDVFDLYVFEHNLFSISITETLTRLLITAELALGIMLIFNIYARFAYFSVLFFLAGFTLYLFISPYFFDVDITNCQCFGNAIVLNRIESISKNIILLLCLIFISPKFSVRKKWEKYVVIALISASFITLMVINTPNYLYTIVHKEKTQIDIHQYKSALLSSGKEKEFTNGKQIICMYAVMCKYCKRSALKLHLILKNNQLSDDNVKAIFWSETPDTLIHKFFSEQRIPIPEYTTFRVDTFLNITNGKIPVFLFSDNGTIIHTENYTTLNEKQILEFFSSD
jgi:uncharacterized membrane protein YphA (DoxX/SURF4 family)